MKHDKIVAVIRAGMNSTSFPKDAMKCIISGKTALELVISRTRAIPLVDEIVVATTVNKNDNYIARLCRDIKCDYFRGSEKNVLDRCCQAVKDRQPSKGIVMLTGDSVLLDPNLVNEIIKLYVNSDFEYITNNNPATYPDGMDIEVFTFSALYLAWKNTKTKADKKHVTLYLQKHKNIFKTMNLKYKKDISDKIWRLNTIRDFNFIQRVYKELYPKNKLFGMKDILDLLEKKPEIEKLNFGESQNQLRSDIIHLVDTNIKNKEEF